jgi:hypothetical protein
MQFSINVKVQTNEQNEAIDDVARFQFILDALLPSSMSKQHEEQPTLLRLGAPATDRQFQSALDIVKPSQRFALLLVGGVAS